jgi:hypothetical protein
MIAESLLRIPFSLTDGCFLVPTSRWLQGKCARINLSHAASDMILNNHKRLPESIVALGLCCGLLEGFSKSVI